MQRNIAEVANETRAVALFDLRGGGGGVGGGGQLVSAVTFAPSNWRRYFILKYSQAFIYH